jgi:glycosyltransferase involved in cell wall biosynthesis
MFDLLPTVPYYTASLCAALRNVDGVTVRLGSNTYYLDPDAFRREDLSRDRWLLDAISRLRRSPAAIRRPIKIVEYLSNLCLLTARLAIAPVDVLHVQFLPMLGKLPFERWFLRAMRVLGIRIVYTVHNVLPQDDGLRYREKYRETYHLAAHLICHDPKAQMRLIEEFEIDPKRISVIPHGPLLGGASTQRGNRRRAALGLSRDECLVLWQGIVKPYKGLSFLLDSWKSVHERGVKARLAIVGTGDARVTDSIRQQAKSAGLTSSVHLDFRFVSVEELADYYEAADVLVYPYREITTSGALMTGMRYGKATVATRHPVFCELLRDEDNALMVEYGDVNGFAGKLIRLIQSEALRRTLGKRLLSSAMNYPQWGAIAEQTAECYRKAMSR